MVGSILLVEGGTLGMSAVDDTSGPMSVEVSVAGVVVVVLLSAAGVVVVVLVSAAGVVVVVLVSAAGVVVVVLVSAAGVVVVELVSAAGVVVEVELVSPRYPTPNKGSSSETTIVSSREALQHRTMRPPVGSLQHISNDEVMFSMLSSIACTKKVKLN